MQCRRADRTGRGPAYRVASSTSADAPDGCGHRGAHGHEPRRPPSPSRHRCGRPTSTYDGRGRPCSTWPAGSGPGTAPARRSREAVDWVAGELGGSATGSGGSRSMSRAASRGASRCRPGRSINVVADAARTRPEPPRTWSSAPTSTPCRRRRARRTTPPASACCWPSPRPPRRRDPAAGRVRGVRRRGAARPDRRRPPLRLAGLRRRAGARRAAGAARDGLARPGRASAASCRSAPAAGADPPAASSARRRRARRGPGAAERPPPSDHWSFVRAGLPGARLGSTPYAGYHSRRPTCPAVVDPAQLERVGRVVLAWLR